MYDALHDTLHRLQAAGAGGFEGLIQARISRVTSRNFFLAKAGAQAGKDASTAGYGDTYIAIECKRYKRDAPPAARDLLGGLAEAIDAGAECLDLWLVVSTGAVGSREAETLRRHADTQGVAVEIIDWQETGLPQLAVLCAAFPEETLDELRARGASSDLAAVAADLEAVRVHPSFSDQLADLQRRLSTADLGFDHARVVANAWIDTRLARHADAMAAFHQALCVGDANFQPYVERALPRAALESWYEDWSGHQSLAAILGREGNGKSWATMAWWNGLTTKPLTLVVTSNRMAGSDAVTIVTAALVEQTGVRDLDFWKRRVLRWLKRPRSAAPAFLLILDGLNERPRQSWDEVFGSLAESAWAGHLAVVTTCRPEFWSERISPFLRTPVTRIDVEPFDEVELARAWGDRRPRLAEMSQPVRDFLRTPRILRIARNHVARLMESGDLTVERLLIEDWVDRRRLKHGLAHTVPEFNNLVIGLAKEVRQGVLEFGQHQLRAYSSLAQRSPDRDLDRDFGEIIDGHLFEPVDQVSGRYRVRRQHVGLALGMLLAREVRDEYRCSQTAGVESVLVEALDPVADLDQTSAVLRGACTVAFLEEGYPAEARRVLLREWLQRLNLDDAQWQDFAAYVPLDPTAFFDLAEYFWLTADVYPTAREWVAAAILRWRNHEEVMKLTATRCVHWMGLWHSDWFPFLSKPDPERLARQRAAVRENWSRLTDSERGLTNQLLSEAPSSQAPFRVRLALLLVSHGPRAPHVDAFVAWALSRAIMTFPDEAEEVAWCLRLNQYDPAETEAAILGRVEALLEDASEVGTKAARHLLWALGTPAAAARRARLPAPPPPQVWPPWPTRRLINVDPLDPAAPAPADLEPVMTQLAQLDPARLYRTLGHTSEEHGFDELEPSLARFAPDEIGRFYRQILRSASERRDVKLRQLGWEISKHLMLIGSEEARALDQARRSLFALLEGDVRDARATEAYILAGELVGRTAQEQLDLVLERPQHALDLLMFEDVLAAAPSEVANEHIVGVTVDGCDYKLLRLFWILSCSAFVLDDAARRALIRAFSHSDPWIRAYAFRLAETCRDRAALRVHASTRWRASWDDTTRESFYGSLALIAAADPVDYIALRDRVVLALLGYLAHRDGTPGAIDAFAEDLDALWEGAMRTPIPSAAAPNATLVRKQPNELAAPELEITSIESPAEADWRTNEVFGRGPGPIQLDVSFEGLDRQRREFEERVQKFIADARDAGHRLFGTQMPSYALAQVIEQRPDLAEKWIGAILQSDAAPWGMAEFYRTLCIVLGGMDPDRAAEILSRVDRGSPRLRVTYVSFDVDSTTWHAFQLPSSEKVDALRTRILDEACTDEPLLQIALAAQANGATNWLDRAIRKDLAAPGVHRAARALTLIGFLDEGPVLDALRSELDRHEGFLEDVATCVRNRLDQNRRARAWFAQFLTRRDPTEAWAAFRLFLRCVDRRFYLWGDSLRETMPDLPILWRQQLNLNDQDIRRAAKDNEGRLSEVLFGLRISQREIAPWYPTPPTAGSP